MLPRIAITPSAFLVLFPAIRPWDNVFDASATESIPIHHLLTKLMISQDLLFSNLPLYKAIDRHPLTASPETPLMGVISMISPQPKSDSDRETQPHRKSCVLAVEQGKLVGLITERDLVRLATQYRSFDHLTLAAVMTRDLVTLSIEPHQDIFTAITLMRQHQIRHLPVLSKTGELVGLISTQTLRECLQPGDLFKLRQVAEAMTRDVIHATPNASILHLAQLMAEYRVSCVVIAEPKIGDSFLCHPVGIVTERDIVKCSALDLNFDRMMAADIMSSPLCCLHPTENLWVAHELMQQWGVRRLVVCDEQQQLVGILTQTSLLQTLNPLELYNTIEALQQQVNKLQGERIKQMQNDHHQTREELQKQRDLTEAILDTVPALIVVLNTQGYIVKFNQACVKITGYSGQEVQDRPFWEILLVPEEVNSVKKAFADLTAGNFPSYHENYWVTKTGDRRLIAWSNTILCDDGEVEYIIGTGKDITERRRAEIELESQKEAYRQLASSLEEQVESKTAEIAESKHQLELEINQVNQIQKQLIFSQERLNDLLNSSLAIIYSSDPETMRVTFISSNVQNVLGYTQKEFQESVEFWEERIHPEDRDFAWSKVREVLRKGTSFYEYRFRHGDGSDRWMQEHLRLVLDAAEKPREVVGYGFDISDRKQAEIAAAEREAILSSFYNSTSMMMGVVELIDGDIIHIFSNNATAEFWGVSPESLKNARCSEMGVPASIIEFWSQHYRESQQLGKPIKFEYIHTLNSQEHHLSVTISPILNSGLDKLRFCYIAEDITQAKQTEYQLYKITQDLLNSQKIAGIGTWEYNVSSGKITWSEEVFRIYGMDPTQGEPTLAELREKMHPDDRDRHAEDAERSLTLGEPFYTEYRLVRPSGEIRYIQGMGGVEHDAEWQPLRLFGSVIDITEKRQAEMALSASEAKYRRLIEQMPAATYTANLDDKFSILYISPQIERLLGISASEWLKNSKDWLELVHPEDRDRLLEEIRQGIEENQGFSVEYRMFSRSGNVVWVRDNGQVVLDDQGNPTFLQGVMINITDKKETEIALQESEEKFRQIAETVREVFFMTSFDGQTILYINPAYEKIWGQSCASLYENPQHWINSVHPEDLQRVIEAYQRQFQDKLVFDEEYRIIRPDSTIRWVAARVFPVTDKSGKIYRWAGIAEDITSRKLMLEQLQNSKTFIQKVTDYIPNILYICDLIKKRNVYINRNIQDILGYTYEKIQETGGTLLYEILHPEDLPIIEKHFQDMSKAQDGQIYTVEYRVQKANGEWRWLLSRDLVFSRHSDGRVQEILGTATDFTDRKQTEEILHTTYQHLKQKNREMEIVSKMIEFLQACDAVEEGYEAIAEFLKQLFPDFSGAVLVIDPDSPESYLEAVSTFGELPHQEIKFPFKDCWALRRGKIHVASDQQPGLFCNHINSELLPKYSLCIPLIAKTKIWGLLYMITESSFVNMESSEQLGRTVADQLSLALFNLKLQEQLRLESIRDPLTGLFNRRYLQETLNQALAKAHRKNQPLCIIMIDIDHFKHFNDTFGHEAGDLVLQEIAHFIQTNIRSSDTACRYGGEEMTLILPDTTLEIASDRAQFLCEGIRGLKRQHHNRDLGQITASFGVASFPEHAQTLDDLLRLADDALYLAKNQGRDRVVVWEFL
ncbi:MAG: PAS domain-containing protein [Limnospira sp. PMC 1291.21]|uniref:PAS domain-containing protein n=1 Tax=unclassified Limnospira TaxID=2642885 RepID=UPI0028E0B381|nr:MULTISPECIES: PAS domain-containing protein [unclassified Limnospira]MDT9176979.1 PAS domain-containing protein [Limnospira sp. PMC 1238.20]MDT9223109.1 PAS domain-containing protein [Limnospira sp. PMC 1279.21]MDT9227520.1 PAS domain-containing protein [Limnospira sp. PMC 1242.20]MDT9238506.1 PAS domain-containing protein [Limnospira sp. PMC 1261.20]MDT9248570.1 PAS domain-containing protein [Limnospira sp. PMC 1280.21]